MKTLDITKTMLPSTTETIASAVSVSVGALPRVGVSGQNILSVTCAFSLSNKNGDLVICEHT